MLLACLGPGAHSTEAQQQIRIESIFPRQLPSGQTTVVTVALPSRDAITAAEISPAQGVTVSGIKLGPNIQGALTWSELTIDVARDASAGERTLVVVLPMGRSAPAAITIPDHVPRIAELGVVAAQTNPSTLELQLAAVDASADLGELPYVWFTIGCGGESLAGVVRGKATARGKGNSLVRASLPNPRPPAGRGSPASGTCNLRVRVTDSAGIESNTLRTTVGLKN
jgi:hypothetical protein